MKLSAYNIAMGVKQRRYPYKACIQSALSLADEFCIGYDPRFDDPLIFTSIDPRVRPIKLHFDFETFDFLAMALTETLRQCYGDWCLLLSMDEVLHEKDSNRILNAMDEAAGQGAESVFFGQIMMCQGYLNPVEFLHGGRHTISVNEPWLYHRTPAEGIAIMDSPYWDGKYIKPGFDDMEYFDARRGGRYLHEKNYHLSPYRLAPSEPLESEVKARLPNYAYMWHYAWYNWSRKREQASQTHVWQNRTYGRSANLDIDKQVRLLQETIIMNPEYSYAAIGEIKKAGWVEVAVDHPIYVRDWLESMGLDAV